MIMKSRKIFGYIKAFHGEEGTFKVNFCKNTKQRVSSFVYILSFKIFFSYKISNQDKLHLLLNKYLPFIIGLFDVVVADGYHVINISWVIL